MPTNLPCIDCDFWKRLKQGDAAALGGLYDLYVDKLFALAFRRTNNRDMAKDLVQEVFVEIWNYRYSIAEVKHSFSYLAKVLQGVFLKRLKADDLAAHLQLQETLVSPDENIETVIISRDTHNEKEQRLNHAMSKLSQRQKQVLSLHFEKGLQYDQIAKLLNINYQSVNNLAFRSIIRLRKLMDNLATLLILAALTLAIFF